MHSKPDESQGKRLLMELFLRGKRIFNMDDAIEVAPKLSIPQTQLKKILSNLAKKHRLLRLRRGLYVGIDVLSPEGKNINHINPFVISTYLVRDSVISHWSAMQHHGFTEQIPNVIIASSPNKVITAILREQDKKSPQKKHALEVAGIRYEYIQIKPEKYFDSSVEKIWVDPNFCVNITDKERTILDSFIFSKMFGGMGEVLGILEANIKNIDIKKLIEYAIQYDKITIIKRLGWALEYFGVSSKYLTPLLKIDINYYCRLDPSKPPKGSCDKRWMIQNNLEKNNK